MMVYVVTCNDCPDAVFSSRSSAQAYVEGKERETRGAARRVYWRIYEFGVST